MYDKDGLPISMLEFGRLTADAAYSRIARTQVVSAADPSKAFDVSTVWLGLDHGMGGPGAPIIFETMVFAEDWDGLDCRRYCTQAQARQGHIEMVTIVASTLDDAIVMDAEP